jgi:hypothetical protein
MAVNVNGYISLLANITDSRTAVSGAGNELGTRAATLSAQWAIQTGTAAGLADKVWSDTRTVTTGALDTIDLAGALTDSFGVIFTVVKLRAILVAAAAANTTTLTLSRPTNGSNLFAALADAVASLSAGGMFVWADPAAGVSVTGGSTDLVSITNSSGASATYTIVLVGTSA